MGLRTIGRMETIEDLFRRKGLVYRHRCRIADVRLTSYDWSTSAYYRANLTEFEQLTDRYGDALRRAVRPRLSIREVGNGVGLGLFADQDLRSGDLVGEYAGVIQENSDAPPDVLEDGHYLSDYSWNFPDELPDGTEFEINAMHEGNELRFANHSANPNMAVDHTLVDGIFVTFFRMVQDCPHGTQLFVSYGDEYWEGGYRELQDL